MTTTLITGGVGIIGSTMANKLLADGERVVLLDIARATEQVESLQQEHGDALVVRRGDVLDFGDLGAALREHEADAIVHLAYVLGAESNANPQTASRVNIEGTVNVLELARLLDVPRVLMASSIAVYGDDSMYGSEQLPLREDVPLHVAPQLPVYGAGKLYLEKLSGHYADKYGLNLAGMRPSIVYGWGRRSGATGWLSQLVERPAVGQPAEVGFGDAKVSVVHVDDVASQFIALLRADDATFEQRRFFNTGGATCTVRDIADTVGRLVPDADITVTSEGEPDLYGLAASVSDRSMEELVGYTRRFTSLEDGIRDYLNTARGHAGLERV